MPPPNKFLATSLLLCRWLNSYVLASHFYIVQHVSIAKLLHASVLGCISWTRQTDTAAENGLFYGLATEAACMTACLRFPTCAAIDLGPVGCVLHNVSDLTTTYYAPGTTHFILSRNCQPPSQLTSESPLNSTMSEAVTTGMSWKVISFLCTPLTTEVNFFSTTNIDLC